MEIITAVLYIFVTIIEIAAASISIIGVITRIIAASTSNIVPIIYVTGAIIFGSWS